MISVIEVYNAVRDLANKDQKGFVTPRVFNAFASVAQMAVYNTLFASLAPAHSIRNRGGDAAGGDSALRSVKDDVSRYVTESALDGSDDTSLNADNNLFAYPANFKKLISLRVNNDERTDVALIYDPAKIGHILGSHLSSPSEQYPVALVADSVELFPSDINSVILTYYRLPAASDFQGVLSETDQPKISVLSTDEDGLFVPNVIECFNFDLPEHYKTQLIGEIAKMIGIRLRDAQLLASTPQE